ncbi:MAG: PAS domain-containing protein [Spirochaetales bacterium]|nr:PAS domain-containing protein [Spirochaetales bacterium]
MKHNEKKLKKESYQKQINKLKKTGNKLEANHKMLQNEINGKNKEIKQKNNLLERIFSNTHILIAYLDTNFNFIQVNNTYANYNKKAIDYYIGKNYFELFPDKEYEKIFKQVAKTGKPYIVFGEKFNYYMNTEKPDCTYWDWSLHPVKDRKKAIDGVILTLLDVTERVKAQQELEEVKEQLLQSKRLSDLGLLAAAVAHELRNPLSVIQAALYNIERKKGNAPIQNQLHTIEKKIMEGDQTISNLLTYAKIKLPEFKRIDILTLLDESVDLVKLILPIENIQINKFISDDFNSFIKIDPFQIKKVFNNVLLNSFQSIKKSKGIINIHAKTVNNVMKLTIIDNGSGIKKADLSNVFNPFFTRKSRGTGLGLSICMEIINLHNGNISIDSTLLKGTTIRIELPYRK